MRRRLVLGVSVAGLLSSPVAVGQFAADQVRPGMPQPKAAAPFGPVSTGTPTAAPTVPPSAGGNPGVGYPAPGGRPAPGFAPSPGFQPAPSMTPAAPPVLEIPSLLDPNHPWTLKPETGPVFILVKSYSRPARPDPNDPGLSALELGTMLATEIRETYKVGAYLFEYISEEKRAEYQARAKALQQREAFRSTLNQYQQRSQVQGMEFLEPDNRIFYKTFRYRDQIAVLVGPFQTEEDALKALAKVKKDWVEPKDKRLMDGGSIVKPGPNGKPVIEKGLMNPYPQAIVVKNPAISQASSPMGQPKVNGLDEFVVRLNEGRPYSLLKASKGWTLAVKSFGTPVQIQSKDSDNRSMVRMPGANKAADVLAAGGEQAEQLAKALREMRGKPPERRPLNLEAFVLHTRNASIVTVGQFDGPNDPALMETRQLLMGLTFQVGKEGVPQRMFEDLLLPMPIPRPMTRQ